MRAFIVLCLVAVACADSGYNYGRNSVVGGGNSYGRDSSYADDVGGPVSYDGSNSGSEYNKEFYTFSANEADFHDPNASQRIAASLKKNLRVIFIKSPENRGLEDAALALAKNAADQKTAVYVLHKQTDLDDLANRFNNLRKDSNQRPDVHFVKYRTPEDAANAQRQIQSQYDSLGGSSKSINGGIAQAINFASKAPIRAGGSRISSPNSEYLPASVLRRLRFRNRL